MILRWIQVTANQHVARWNNNGVDINLELNYTSRLGWRVTVNNVLIPSPVWKCTADAKNHIDTVQCRIISRKVVTAQVRQVAHHA